MPNEVTQEDLAAYAADAAPTAAESEDALARITRTAAEARLAQADVDRCEAALKEAQERLRSLTERVLPELMAAAKQDRLTTAPDEDGLRWDLTRGEALRASIPAENLPRAVMKLNAEGYGSVVKRLLTLQFGKGEEQRATRAVELLRTAGFAPEEKLSVHPQTLGATLREMLADGKEVDMALFGAHVMPFVKIKPAAEGRVRAKSRAPGRVG